MTDDRIERIQRGLEAFSRMMRPPLPDVDDPEAAAKITQTAAELEAEFAVLGLSRSELDDVRTLYFEGHDAVRGIRNERVAKLAYLEEHAPGARGSAEAFGRLTDQQRAEFGAITADDLGGEDGLG